MKISEELKNLEDFKNTLDSNKVKRKEINYDNQDVTGIRKYFSKYINEYKMINYFRYIAKDNTKFSEAKLNLAIELKTLLNYYQVHSYILGMNILYFALLLKRKNVFGINTIISLGLVSFVSLSFYRYNYLKIFGLMNNFFYEDIENLHKNITREEAGFTNKMKEDLTKAEVKVKESEEEKYEINPNTQEKSLKIEYANKTYNQQERMKLIDLIKFYADWLYSPIDEELENKLYFLDEAEVEDYFYPKLKEEFEKLSLDDKMKESNVFGIKIINDKI